MDVDSTFLLSEDNAIEKIDLLLPDVRHVDINFREFNAKRFYRIVVRLYECLNFERLSTSPLFIGLEKDRNNGTGDALVSLFSYLRKTPVLYNLDLHVTSLDYYTLKIVDEASMYVFSLHVALVKSADFKSLTKLRPFCNLCIIDLCSAEDLRGRRHVYIELDDLERLIVNTHQLLDITIRNCTFDVDTSFKITRCYFVDTIYLQRVSFIGSSFAVFSGLFEKVKQVTFNSISNPYVSDFYASDYDSPKLKHCWEQIELIDNATDFKSVERFLSQICNGNTQMLRLSNVDCSATSKVRAWIEAHPELKIVLSGCHLYNQDLCNYSNITIF